MGCRLLGYCWVIVKDLYIYLYFNINIDFFEIKKLFYNGKSWEFDFEDK